MENTKTLREMLVDCRDCGPVSLAEISRRTGINRRFISEYANYGTPQLKPEQEKQILDLLSEIRTQTENALEISEQPPAYKTTLDLYETSGYREGIGWCALCVKRRSFGAMIGNPGTGKTTIIKEFAKRTPGVAYIEAWPGMRMGDLLGAVAGAIGVPISGNTYKKIQQIITALKERSDVVLLIDEAEHLHKWDVDKFDVLRKIWDNTRTPTIICGTQVLHRILTRESLAQLYRRMIEIKLEGIKPGEARTILRDYNITKDATEALAEIAADKDHGSMGTFAELLGICLETAASTDGKIDLAMTNDARRYKMMYR